MDSLCHRHYSGVGLCAWVATPRAASRHRHHVLRLRLAPCLQLQHGQGSIWSLRHKPRGVRELMAYRALYPTNRILKGRSRAGHVPRPTAPFDTFRRHDLPHPQALPVLLQSHCTLQFLPLLFHTQVGNRAPAPLRHCGRNRSGHPHPEAGRGRPASVLRRQVAVRGGIHCAMHYYMQKVLGPSPAFPRLQK